MAAAVENGADTAWGGLPGKLSAGLGAGVSIGYGGWGMTREEGSLVFVSIDELHVWPGEICRSSNAWPIRLE